MLPFLAEDTPRQHNADEGTRHNTDETGPRRRDNKHRRDNKRRRHKADDTRQGKRGVGFNLSCGLALQPVEEVFPLAGRAHSKALTGEGATGSCGRCYNAIARELHVSVLLVVLISIVVVLGVRVLGVLGGGVGGFRVRLAAESAESAAEDSGHQAVETAGVSVSSQACTVRSVLLSNLT